MLKKSARILCAVLALCLMVVLCACNGGNEGGEPTKNTYSVLVASPNGSGIEGVDVYVYEGEELVWYGKTDAAGKMSFTSKETAQNWTAVLSNVPEGYELAESYPITGLETVINLTAGQMKEDDMETLRYKLGDIVKDFSVVDSEGNTLKLSELLKTKKAVVLNFWYEACVPCKMEFPYLQQAYEQYSEKIEVIAMNPTDRAEAVAAFRAANGYTFPMAAVDSRWENVMQLTSCPTTVVIDRFGNISLIHVGGIDETQIFSDVFEYFTADDYKQKFMESIEEVRAALADPGSAAAPLEFGGVTEFEVTVPAGKMIYCDLFKMSDMILSVENSNVYVVYEGKTYGSVNGVLSLEVNSPDAFTPAKLQFGNIGTKEQTYQVKLIPIPGTIGDPFELELGQFETKLAQGSERGVYYNFAATESGTLVIRCDSASQDVVYDYTLYNMNTYEYVTMSETKSNTVSLKLNAGDVIQMTIGTQADKDGNSYPAADFLTTATFVGDETPADPENPEDPSTPTVPDGTKVTYTVTVLDEFGEYAPGVTVTFTGANGTGTAVTDAEGKAKATLLEGTYTVKVTAPSGYIAPANAQVTKRNNTAEMILEVVVPEGYEKLYVGNAFILSVGNNTVAMQSSGLNYLVFTPATSGQYRLSVNAGKVTYYGNNTGFIQDVTDSIQHTDTTITFNVKEDHLGSTFIFAVSGSAASGTVSVTRIGDAQLDITDQPWVTYEGTVKPNGDFTKPAGKLTYVDITAATSAYTLEKRADGYYYINGKLAYVGLTSAPYISLATPAQTSTGVRAYVEQADGSVIKEDYTQLVLEWVDCADTNTGAVALNDDLIHIFKDFGADQFWWDASMNGYLIDQVPNLNTEIAWMFAIGYVA